jgi:hypothetical protein
MGAPNEATFKITGTISLAIIGTVLFFILSIGTLAGNYFSMEKRVTTLELREEKACTTMNQILVINGKIEQNLQNIKENLAFHMLNDKKGAKE